jgi:hypothetical protein
MLFVVGYLEDMTLDKELQVLQRNFMDMYSQGG